MTAAKYPAQMHPLIAFEIAPNKIPMNHAAKNTIGGVHQRIWLLGNDKRLTSS
jgi:hypothetical protein